MNRLFRLGAGLILLLCAGCSLSSPPASFYTLSAAASPANGRSQLALGIALSEFPEALDRPQIMLRSSENRLEIQELHRWAGSLQSQFLQILSENLVRLTGSQRIVPAPWDRGFAPDRRLSLALLRFDGVPGGSALLRVRWSVADASGQLLQLRTSTIEEPAGNSIESLVAAQSRLIARLAEEIASTLPSP